MVAAQNRSPQPVEPTAQLRGDAMGQPGRENLHMAETPGTADQDRANSESERRVPPSTAFQPRMPRQTTYALPRRGAVTLSEGREVTTSRAAAQAADRTASGTFSSTAICHQLRADGRILAIEGSAGSAAAWNRAPQPAQPTAPPRGDAVGQLGREKLGIPVQPQVVPRECYRRGA